MNISELINSLNLIYYDFDSKKNILVKDINYSNKYTKLEFFKITYYLTKKSIPFNILSDKTIKLSKNKFELKGYFSTFLENIKNSNKNIFFLDVPP